MSSLFFLKLLIWILSLCPLVFLAEGSSLLLFFFKEPALCFFDSLDGSFCFYLVNFCSEFDYFLSSTPLWHIFCSRAFNCSVKLLVYSLSTFFLEALRAMGFSLSTTFFSSHRFRYVVFLFSLNSRKSLNSFFIYF